MVSRGVGAISGFEHSFSFSLHLSVEGRRKTSSKTQEQKSSVMSKPSGMPPPVTAQEARGVNWNTKHFT